MGAVLVTGVPGSGKTSVAAALTRKGELSLNTDDDPGLCRWLDSSGNAVEYPGGPDAVDWLNSHRWQWRLDRLDQLIAQAGPRTLFVCGNESTGEGRHQPDALRRFERIYLLDIDRTTMWSRLDAPGRDHGFGQQDSEREWLRSWHPRFRARTLAKGAVRIDARQPLDLVVDAVLADHARFVDAYGRTCYPDM